ncbi:GTP-binding protein [Hyphomicrobiales bacterium]|nr:GTP-binding protein [Hyphomicrobiales bacterium]CAH1675808.1 GTP-binding protein [Hyphomicrobiales bacterium]
MALAGMDMMNQERIPVNLLTGFLGSGKTTLLNSWLRDPAFADVAVIVNEFGEIGIDHTLIAASNDNTIELSTGCLCCSVSGDLVTTLRELNEKRARGEIRPFTRVFIETTGVADPVPVIQSLMTFPVAGRYVLNRIITVVDALHGQRTITDFEEAARQVVVADDIILSKTDLATVPDELVALLKARNPSARVLLSSSSAPVMPTQLLEPGAFNPQAEVRDMDAWLVASGLAPAKTDEHSEAHAAHRHHAHDHTHHDHAHDGHAHEHSHHHHGSDFTTFTLTFDKALAWEHVAHWLDALVIAHGDDLLRVKGILNIEGQDKPVVVQSVQRLFHPPFQLPSWPASGTSSRIVFITRGLTRDYVSRVLATITSRPEPSRLAG